MAKESILLSCIIFTTYLVVFGTQSPENEPGEKICNQGESYYDGCNWCRCLNGVTACTMRGCRIYNLTANANSNANLLPQSRASVRRVNLRRVSRQKVDEKLQVLSNEDNRCSKIIGDDDSDDEATFDGCNWCWCEDGEEICTEKVCEK